MPGVNPGWGPDLFAIGQGAGDREMVSNPK